MRLKANFTNPQAVSMKKDYDFMVLTIMDPCYFVTKYNETFYQG